MSPSIRFLLVLIFAVAGWQHARHLTRKYGRPPFGLPDWVWGIVTGLSLLIGIVLLAVAERGLRKTPLATPAHPAVFGYGRTMTVVPGQAGLGEPLGYDPSGGAKVAPLSTLVAEAAAVPPSWAADPSGRHQYRWWDGAAWTTSVHSNVVTSTDQP